MYNFAQKTERDKRAVERRKAAAMEVFSGYWKLRAIADGLLNLDRQIDEEYKQADAAGLNHLLPCEKVGPFVGANHDYQTLDAKELVFLFDQKKADLVGEIDLLTRRAKNIDAVLVQYNQLKASLGDFNERNSEEVVLHEGTRATIQFSGKYGRFADLRRGVLNNLLGQLQHFLEGDLKEALRVADAYLEAAKLEYSSDFPEFKHEWSQS